jgi:hypothetical protein
MFIPNPHTTLTGVALDGRTPKVDVLAYITGGYVINDNDLLVGPNVITALLPEDATQPKITPRAGILHSNAGGSPSRWQQLRAFLLRASETEPHLQHDMDGTIAQLMRYTTRADCNYKANRYLFAGTYYGALSHETADLGAKTLDVTPWPLPQFAGLVGSLTCEAIVYRIRCTATTTWQDSGIGYHSQFPEWSVYKGKTCPGRARILQMDGLRAAIADRVAKYYELCGGGCP